MKVSKEVKTAILVIASILLFIWGYSYLKGRDLLVKYKTLFVEYENVEGLAKSAPVTINGLVVGKVSNITLDNTTAKIKVEIQINSDFPIRKNSVAEIYAPSPIGGKEIAIIPSKSGPEIEDGGFFVSSSKLGLTDELAKQMEPLKDKITKLLDNANVMFENINQVLDAKSKDNLRKSLADLSTTVAQFKSVASDVNSIVAQNKPKLNATFSNFEKTSTNLSKISDSISKVNFAATVQSLQKTLSHVNGMMATIESGKGTMGKIMNDEALYLNLNKTSKELELLLQDLRLNPTRYINVSLFGKKNKPYAAPAKDTIK
ncbi:MlaD family protein [Flavobacterium aciduliphilum]|uniref:MlaD family protein n=1 Tax=Flavobacterium aciduliphilum TaxID=1101402 RepID=UPI000DD2FD57|nr:MlaD family protein [Flavobacterium aciduliphilum]